MAKLRPPKAGCYKGSYPDTSWTEIPCGKPPKVSLIPSSGSGRGVGPATVGGSAGGDLAAQAPALSWAEGSFPLVDGVTNESANGVPNAYSLQLNTNFFPQASGCVGANCQGWQQFAYLSDHGGIIEWWMAGYDGSCPIGWDSFSDPKRGNDCFINSNVLPVPSEPITNLAEISVTGIADSADSLMISVGSELFLLSQASVLGLAGQWNTAEFNVFGDGGGNQAVFNTGSTVVVQTLTDSPGVEGPSCTNQSHTGETNNLSVVADSCCMLGGSFKGIQFTETNAAGQGSAACPVAPTASNWSAIDHPFDELVTGVDADGAPLMSCRAPWNGVQVGKTRAEWNGCDIAYGGGEYLIEPYVTLTASWSPAETNGDVPTNAWPFGVDGPTGATLYACRAYLNGNGYQVGKIGAGLPGCDVPYGGVEQIVPEYEVLTTLTPLRLQAVDSASPPSSAVVGGYDSDGAELFVCQASVGGGFVPGKTRADWSACDVPFNGQEVPMTSYNVLVPNFQTAGATWAAGTDGDGSTLGICRASDENNSVQVGKLLASGACDYGFGGQEVSVGSDFQRLSPAD